MSIVQQNVFIQREAEIRAAYGRDRERLQELSTGHLQTLEELLRRAPAIEGLNEILDYVRGQHEQILAQFKYSDYREWALQSGYRLRHDWYGYVDRDLIRAEIRIFLRDFVNDIQESSREAQRFLRLLAQTSLEDAESLHVLLREVPSYATQLQEALQKRREEIERKHLREKIQATYQSIEAINPKAAIRSKALLQQAFETASAEQLRALLSELEALHAQEKVAEPLRRQIRTTYETLQLLRQKRAVPFESQIATLEETAAPSELNELLRALEEALIAAHQELSEIAHQKAVAQELMARLSAVSRETLSALQDIESQIDRLDEVAPLKKIVETLTYHLLRQERLALSQGKAEKIQEGATQAELFEEYRRRGALYYERLGRLDAAQAREAQPFYEELRETTHAQRARALKDELQYRYLKALEAHLESEELKARVASVYRAFPVESLKEEVEAFLKEGRVTAEAAHPLVQKILSTWERKPPPPSADLRARAEEELVHSLTKALKAKGYQLLSDDMTTQLLRGEMVELRTPYGPDYAIRLRMENGALNMRFIRYVEDENHLSDYERQKDKAIGHRWCQDYDSIRALLEANGIYLHTSYRVEPDKEFYYIRRSEEVGRSRQLSQQAPQAQKKKPS